MSSKEYLIKINRDKCPPKCEFRQRKDVEFALIPPPDEILGIVISRDPTVSWLYGYLKMENDLNTCRKILFASAIPLVLLTKVLIFMRGRIDENDKKYLFDKTFHKTYWTHLHKCPTDITNKMSIEFKPKNANRCADQWLRKELNLAINNKTKFIIALGNDVQKWVKKWKDKDGKDKTIEIINLPHPSGRNRKWNNKDDKIISETVERLIGLCREN